PSAVRSSTSTMIVGSVKTGLRGFAADRLSCHRFRANAFRLLLHSFAYNLVNPFRLHLPLSLRSAQIETLRTRLFKRRPHSPDGSLRAHPLGQRVALSNVSSKPSHSPLTPVSPLPLVELGRSWQSKAELCPKNDSLHLRNASALEMKPYRPRLTALQPPRPHSPAHFSHLMN